MTTVLILGGYGAVGRHAATALTDLLPGGKVIVAGRNPDRAEPIPGTVPVRVDAADPAALAAALADVDVVLMCLEHDNVGVARACLRRGIHYLDVSATHRTLAAIEDLDELAQRNRATAVLSVGLVPGISNLLARQVTERRPGADLRIGVLLGAGERHGPAALAWTLDGLGQLHGSWTMRFPAPFGVRTVRRFPFSDQFTLPATLGVPSVTTGLCLDSRLFTALLAAGGSAFATRLLRRPRVRRFLLTALGNVHLGGEDFAVTVQADNALATFSGRGQSRATGLAAALLITRLRGLRPGVAHVEQLVDPADFLTELATDHGFALNLK